MTPFTLRDAVMRDCYFQSKHYSASELLLSILTMVDQITAVD
jgi:hypothetical protein